MTTKPATDAQVEALREYAECGGSAYCSDTLSLIARLDAAEAALATARADALEEAARLVEQDVHDPSIRLDPKRHKSLSDWFAEQRAAAIRALKEKTP
jgi:hypothetical protein